ncbi:MAG TPA: phage holin family protein, partial [Rhodocyclaceae bacterium]|nr:phage holin family protein [Rhodocyclaceae bacterium]
MMDPRLKIAIQWLLNAVALMLLPEVIGGLEVESYTAALVTALLLGLINALIRPFLILVTLPITLLSLGLFTLVINALLFWGVASLVAGVHVSDFW